MDAQGNAQNAAELASSAERINVFVNAECSPDFRYIYLNGKACIVSAACRVTWVFQGFSEEMPDWWTYKQQGFTWVGITEYVSG